MVDVTLSSCHMRMPYIHMSAYDRPSLTSTSGIRCHLSQQKKLRVRDPVFARWLLNIDENAGGN